MKTLLITAYAVNPYKGSEDGTGWNWSLQLSKYYKTIVITRKNNANAINKYLTENKEINTQNIHFAYFDLPYWARFWKKGERGALLYYYLWQLGVSLSILKRKYVFDAALSLNFHNDWIPHFLWIHKKPCFWGPVGHHEAIPKMYLTNFVSFRERAADIAKELVKLLVRKLDIFYFIAKKKSDLIVCINSASARAINEPHKTVILPAVGAIAPELEEITNHGNFEALCIGRFVPIKGFDLTLKSFYHFVNSCTPEQRKNIKLTIVGKGPLEHAIKKLATKLEINEYLHWIAWMDKEQLHYVYSKSSCYLFPSHEGAGMVVPEALSYGLPIVCLDNAGPGEMMDNSCGFKIPKDTFEKTAIALGQKLYGLYTQPSLLQEMSACARKKFEENFDWNVKGKLLHQELKKYI